jgi:hypothetical protein
MLLQERRLAANERGGRNYCRVDRWISPAVHYRIREK